MTSPLNKGTKSKLLYISLYPSFPCMKNIMQNKTFHMIYPFLHFGFSLWPLYLRTSVFGYLGICNGKSSTAPLNCFSVLSLCGVSSLLLNQIYTEIVTVTAAACNLSSLSETSFSCLCKFSTSVQSPLCKMYVLVLIKTSICSQQISRHFW